MKDTYAVAIKGSQKQSTVGIALELAGQLLRRGELDAARRILCEIRADLDRLTLHSPLSPKVQAILRIVEDRP